MFLEFERRLKINKINRLSNESKQWWENHIPSPGVSSWSRDQTGSPGLQADSLPFEPPGKPRSAMQISSLPRNSDNTQNRDESKSVVICTLLWVPESDLSGLHPWGFCPLASEELQAKGVGALLENQRVRGEGDSDIYSFSSLPAKSPRASVSLYWRPPCWAGGPHHFLSGTLSLPFPACLFRS